MKAESDAEETKEEGTVRKVREMLPSIEPQRVRETLARLGPATSADELASRLLDEAEVAANEAAAIELVTAEPATYSASIKRPRCEELTAAEQLSEVRRALGERWRACGGAGKVAARPPAVVVAAAAAPAPAPYRQLQEARDKLRSRWLVGRAERKRVWTLAELSQLPTAAAEAAHAESHSSRSELEVAKRAWQLSNAFRASQGLPALAWSAALCDIGRGHSRDMSEKRVPFGHAGFDARVRRFPGSANAAAENVAMNMGFGDPAKIAVDGWIASDGHRRNLLGRFAESGVGVYHSALDGKWFFTQLFSI